jgi:molecular chaperone GrpE (heat shock protein)
VVLTPDLGQTVLKTVDFVPLSDNRILCVVVSESGFMDSKVVVADQVLSREELIRISNYLTEQFGGSTLRQARDRLLTLMDDERAQVDRILGLSVSLARIGLESMRDPDLLVEGTASVLMLPELENLGRVRRLFDTFEEKARLVQILNQCLQGRGVRVLIGEDSDLTSELDFSLVATTYGVKDRPLGALGVFGPSRMEYAKVIPLVEYLGEPFDLEIDDDEVDLEAAAREALEAVERVEAAPAAGEGGGEVEILRAEVAEEKDRAMRIMADFENFRKRVSRERADLQKIAQFELFREVLPVVDNMERALAADGSLEDLRAGMEMIQKQLAELLKRHGVMEVEAESKPFDPNVHEAVDRQEDQDVEVPTVFEVLQPGYVMYDRLLRPAMVRVAMPGEEPESEE